MVQRSLIHIATLVAMTAAPGLCVAESVYLIADGGHARRIDDGFVTGVSFTDGNLSFTRLAVGNATAIGGLQVAIGDNVGGVHVLDGGLAGQTGFTDLNGPANDPVTAIAVGSIGDEPHAIAATHLFYDSGVVDLAHLRGNALIFDSTDPSALSLVGSPIVANPAAPNIFYPNGTPNTYVDAAIGELETDAPGNELILAHHQLNSDGSRVASAVQEAGKLREVQVSGGTTGVFRDHTINNYITGIDLGDIRDAGESLTPGGPDDILQFGADNGAPMRTDRNSWQAFSRSPGPGGFPNFNFLNFNAANQASAIVDAVIGELLSGAFGTPPDDPGAPDLRNEVVSVGNELSGGGAGAVPTGNGVIEISNTFSGGCCLQQIIVPDEQLTSVVVSDILDNDDVNEIVVGSALGNVYVFGHTTTGDLTSLFATTPLMTINVGGAVLELAKEYKGRVIPEPATGALMLLGTAGLFSLRRRK